MLVVELACPAGQHDRLIAELWELGTVGVLEGEGLLRAYFSAGSDRQVLESALATYAPRILEEPERDWTALARVLKPGGEAIVSGFRPRTAGRVAQAMQAAGLRARRQLEREGWSALLCYTPWYAQT